MFVAKDEKGKKRTSNILIKTCCIGWNDASYFVIEIISSLYIPLSDCRIELAIQAQNMLK